MNNILLNFFIYLIETLCGHREEIKIDNLDVKSYDSYFLYDLDTFEVTPL